MGPNPAIFSIFRNCARAHNSVASAHSFQFLFIRFLAGNNYLRLLIEAVHFQVLSVKFHLSPCFYSLSNSCLRILCRANTHTSQSSKRITERCLTTSSISRLFNTKTRLLLPHHPSPESLQTIPTHQSLLPPPVPHQLAHSIQ